MPVEIEAYFISFHYPGPALEQDDYAVVKIKYRDGTWEELFRSYQYTKCTDQQHRERLYQVVVEHHAGRGVHNDYIKKMMCVPGRSIARMEPKWIQEDMEMLSQMTMF